MVKKYQKYIPEACYWGIPLNLWILATQVFPSIRIPFSFLGDNETSAFNTVMWTLAASFLSGIFVYYLTVKYKNKRIKGTGTEVNPESWTQLKGSHEA